VQSWPRVSIPVIPGRGYPLRLFDTATNEVRPLALGETARIYVCGITPYDATHIGHASTYLAFDILIRQWIDQGTKVHYVQNVTDVDDPLLERAKETGQTWQDLAEGQTRLFRDDMTALRLIPPDDYIGVVESIDCVTEQITKLEAAGAIYQIDGDLYFRVHNDQRFGQVGHLSADEQLKLFSERGGDPAREGKENPLDALVWRAARPGEPSWESPFGPGRPGWHIECVAIALEKLGMSFDVQGGGSDLVFPHHEMGASQAQLATSSWPYARHYVHTAMVGLDGQKMSKSLGNLVFVSKLLEAGVDAMAIRLAILDHPYRRDWTWTNADIAKATNRLAAWRAAVSPPTGPSATSTLEEMRRALADDLDTKRALAVVDSWAQEQRLRGGEDDSGPGVISRAVDALLGVAL
jgi:L-cysteine:1D-myo-inositol 2-amino-2-deoxy-alpha-D-glucopyranoside ligase